MACKELVHDRRCYQPPNGPLVPSVPHLARRKAVVVVRMMFRISRRIPTIEGSSVLIQRLLIGVKRAPLEILTFHADPFCNSGPRFVWPARL